MLAIQGLNNGLSWKKMTRDPLICTMKHPRFIVLNNLRWGHSSTKSYSSVRTYAWALLAVRHLIKYIHVSTILIVYLTLFQTHDYWKSIENDVKSKIIFILKSGGDPTDRVW